MTGTTGTTDTWTVEELDVPTTMDDDPARVQAFRDWLAVSDAAEFAVHGLREVSWTPAEYLPMCHEPGAPSRLFVVRDDAGEVVASGAYDSRTEPGTTNCWLSLGVRPDRQRRGIGTLLADRLEQLARARDAPSGRPTPSRARSAPVPDPGTSQRPRATAPCPWTRPACAS